MVILNSISWWNIPSCTRRWCYAMLCLFLDGRCLTGAPSLLTGKFANGHNETVKFCAVEHDRKQLRRSGWQVRTTLEIDEIMDVMVIVPAYTWRSSHDQQHVWHCLTMNLRERCWAHWGSTAGWIMSKSSSQPIIESLTRIMHWYPVPTYSGVWKNTSHMPYLPDFVLRHS